LDFSDLFAKNAFTWGFLVGFFISAIITGCISYLIYFITKKRKYITYTIEPKILYVQEMEQNPGISITHFNTHVETLVSSYVILKNFGNTSIGEGDFLKGAPLAVRVSGEYFLPDNLISCIDKMTDPIIGAYLEVKGDDLIVHFDHFPAGKSINLNLFHTGALTIEGRLKSGNLMEDYQFYRSNKALAKQILFYITLAIAAIIILLNKELLAITASIFILFVLYKKINRKGDGKK